MSSIQNDVVIVGAKRSPIGSFLGALASKSAPELGSHAIAAAIKQSGIKSEDASQVYVGNVLQAGVGQAPARQASLGAGIPEGVGCTTINKVCGSGLMTVELARQWIAMGYGDVAISAGMESMTNAPHLVAGARSGFKFGDATLVDAMIKDGLWDVYNDFHMGCAAELCARERGFDRAAQDDFAKQSYERALAAIKSGAFKDEIEPITIRGRKGKETIVNEDEEPGRYNPEKMSGLKPAFEKDGTVTAANASSINDGASACVLTSEDFARKNNLDVLAKITGFANAALKPEWFTVAPSQAISTLMDRTGYSLKDIDLFEINEAFSVVTLAVGKEVGIDLEKVNVNGGAVALGHPIGASGNRILTTLIYALRSRGLKRGVAAICLGGGEAIAMMVETN